MADHVWKNINFGSEECTACGEIRYYGAPMLTDDDCPGFKLSSARDQEEFDFATAPPEPKCVCDVKDLLSQGHNRQCPYYRKGR
jgi:hypothetical protein